MSTQKCTPQRSSIQGQYVKDCHALDQGARASNPLLNSAPIKMERKKIYLRQHRTARRCTMAACPHRRSILIAIELCCNRCKLTNMRRIQACRSVFFDPYMFDSSSRSIRLYLVFFMMLDRIAGLLGIWGRQIRHSMFPTRIQSDTTRHVHTRTQSRGLPCVLSVGLTPL